MTRHHDIARTSVFNETEFRVKFDYYGFAWIVKVDLSGLNWIALTIYLPKIYKVQKWRKIGSLKQTLSFRLIVRQRRNSTSQNLCKRNTSKKRYISFVSYLNISTESQGAIAESIEHATAPHRLMFEPRTLPSVWSKYRNSCELWTDQQDKFAETCDITLTLACESVMKYALL